MIQREHNKRGSCRCDVVTPNWTAFVSTTWFLWRVGTAVYEVGSDGRPALRPLTEIIWRGDGRLRRTADIHAAFVKHIDRLGCEGVPLGPALPRALSAFFDEDGMAPQAERRG